MVRTNRKAGTEPPRRLTRASLETRRQRVLRFLEERVWPTLPDGEKGRRLTRAEEDRLLGYGAEGF